MYKLTLQRLKVNVAQSVWRWPSNRNVVSSTPRVGTLRYFNFVALGVHYFGIVHGDYNYKVIEHYAKMVE
jgi:hypothetical protein